MFSRFQHLERWRFQPYADREDPFKRTYLTRDKLIWRWYCSRIEPPQFCSFWGGGGRPVRGPTDKVEQGKCLCERWVSVKAGTGRRSLLTSEGKDFPKPLCKTTADPAADSGTQAAAACSAARPALKTHWLPPPASLPLSPHVPSTGARLRSPGEAGKREEKQKRLSPCRYDLSGMWQRFTVCEQTRLWCQIQQRADGEAFLANSTFDHYLGTGLKLLTRWHIPLRDWYRACK